MRLTPTAPIRIPLTLTLTLILILKLTLIVPRVSQAMNGQLEFFNVDEFEIMNAGEHFMCTDIEWDPTGRYVATSVTSVHQMENGFNIWSWNGNLLYRRAFVFSNPALKSANSTLSGSLFITLSCNTATTC